MKALGPMERLLLVRAMPGFEQLPDRLVVAMADHASEASWSAGATMHAATDPIESMCMVVEGRVALSRHGAPIGEFEAPTGFGFIDGLARQDTGLAAVAVEPTVGLTVSVPMYTHLLEEWFPLARWVMADIARELLALNGGLLPGGDSMPRPRFEVPPLDAPLGLVERLKVLVGVPVFANVDLDTLLPLARRIRVVRAPAGSTLWDVGDPATWGITILDGTARCTARDGSQLDASAGRPLGFLGALADQPRTYRAAAVTEVVGLAYELDTLMRVAETRFDLSRSILALLSATLIVEQVRTARLIGQR